MNESISQKPLDASGTLPAAGLDESLPQATKLDVAMPEAGAATPVAPPPIPPLPAGTLPPRTEMELAPIVPLPAPIIKEEKEVTKKRRIIWGDIFSCWVLGVGFLLMLLTLALFVLAKSGIVHVPYLSDWLYHPPVPPHYVVAKSMSWSDFNKTVSGRLVEQGLDSEPPLVLQLSEQEFTGLLQGVVENGLRSGEYKAEIAQVIFTPKAIQLYFYLTWNDYFTFEILTHLVPVVENDGTLRLEVIDARFGDLPLPGSWVINLIGYFFARDVGVWQIILSNGYGIRSAVLSNANIELLIGPVNAK